MLYKNINKMKKIVIIISLIGLFVACKKNPLEPITPGSYSLAPTKEKDTTTWVWQYVDSGVLPSWGNVSKYNELVGTVWVLKKVVTDFATSYPNDTIRFVDNTFYTINNKAVIPYQFSAGVGTTSKTLTLNYFYPFGSGHYSGQLSQNFVTDGVINNAEFKNIETTNGLVRAWFEKI